MSIINIIGINTKKIKEVFIFIIKLNTKAPTNKNGTRIIILINIETAFSTCITSLVNLFTREAVPNLSNSVCENEEIFFK